MPSLARALLDEALADLMNLTDAWERVDAFGFILETMAIVDTNNALTMAEGTEADSIGRMEVLGKCQSR